MLTFVLATACAAGRPVVNLPDPQLGPTFTALRIVQEEELASSLGAAVDLEHVEEALGHDEPITFGNWGYTAPSWEVPLHLFAVVKVDVEGRRRPLRVRCKARVDTAWTYDLTFHPVIDDPEAHFVALADACSDDIATALDAR